MNKLNDQTVTICGYCGVPLDIDGADTFYGGIDKAKALIESGCDVLHGVCDDCQHEEEQA